MGDENQICRLGVCLLMTQERRGLSNVMVRTCGEMIWQRTGTYAGGELGFDVVKFFLESEGTVENAF